ncbi:MAG TPA: hypothetical protein VK912_16230 [Longimicrobiales bacterium]|nr:hypothetical protein [Longimicrobiales bacterium]
MAARTRSMAVQAWAVGGIVFLFAEAAWRLGMRGVATVRGGLSSHEWIILVLLTGVFVYGEGYRALQRRWVPYVLARVARLRTERFLTWRIGAPLYAMSLIGPTWRTALRAWAGVAAIITAVLIVSRFPEPWRGIVDIAVAAALIWGAVALIYGALRMLRAGNGEG